MPIWYSNGTVTTKGAMSKAPMQHTGPRSIKASGAFCVHTFRLSLQFLENLIAIRQKREAVVLHSGGQLLLLN